MDVPATRRERPPGGKRSWLHGRVIAPFRPERGHLDVLTGLRGWAALWVFIYHVWSYAKHPPIVFKGLGVSVDFTPFLSIGFAGVTIFFVLSGFLLAIPFAQWQAGQRGRPRLDHYFLRRVMRVFPAYYAQLTILLLLAWWGAEQYRIEDAGRLLRHLCMLFVPQPIGTTPINGVWWTLPIEFSFYMALPFLAVLLRPGRWWLLLILSLGVMVMWRHVVLLFIGDAPIPERVIASYQLPGRMDAFGSGMLASFLYVHRSRAPAWLLPGSRMELLGGLGLVLLIAAIYWLPMKRHEYWSDHLIFYVWTPAVSLAVATLIVAGSAGSRVVNFLFSNRFMIFAGLVSYSLYLWHLPILDGLMRMPALQSLHDGRILPLFLVATPVVILISAVSYVLVEVPGMKFRRTTRHGPG